MADAYDSDEILKAFERAEYEFVLRKAMPYALAGDPDAQCMIALLYSAGRGVRTDFLEAERWLMKAAAQNSALAWHNLGSLYAMKHPGLEERWSDAQKCWQRAADLGFDCVSPYPPAPDRKNRTCDARDHLSGKPTTRPLAVPVPTCIVLSSDLGCFLKQHYSRWPEQPA